MLLMLDNPAQIFDARLVHVRMMLSWGEENSAPIRNVEVETPTQISKERLEDPALILVVGL